MCMHIETHTTRIWCDIEIHGSVTWSYAWLAFGWLYASGTWRNSIAQKWMSVHHDWIHQRLTWGTSCYTHTHSLTHYIQTALLLYINLLFILSLRKPFSLWLRWGRQVEDGSSANSIINDVCIGIQFVCVSTYISQMISSPSKPPIRSRFSFVLFHFLTPMCT